VPIASLPGMAERTLTVSSAGKTFSFTGWKVGWVCGPAPLVSAVRTAKQFLTYVNAAPFQPAIATALRLGDEYYAGVADTLRQKRDLLRKGLDSVGFEVFETAGTFFVDTDISALSELDAGTFCRTIPARCHVVAVPMDVFFDDKVRSRSLVRWTFCKRFEVLEEAVRRLGDLR
jgi:N-succinyldiaminopimelate aminotransferase